MTHNTLSFREYSKDILDNELMLSTKHYIQHGNVSVYSHCCLVAIISFCIAKKFKRFDLLSLSRGALLHDFFLYDWHKKKLTYLHGYKHPKTAFFNSKKHFRLNPVEEDIITKHMWPLTLFQIPKYKESWLVCAVDKLCSILETFRIIRISNDRTEEILRHDFSHGFGGIKEVYLLSRLQNISG